MALYFYVFDGVLFAERFRPALAQSWHCRSFAPARQLCRDLLPAAAAFAERYHLVAEQPLVVAVEQNGLSFDKQLWRALVGEILLFGAVEVPEIQTAPESFCYLLTPDRYLDADTQRERFAPIQQVHFGSRDLIFGNAFYRPEHAGWNDAGDVARLAAYLDALNPLDWQASDLASMPGLAGAEERAEELEFLRDWFPALRDLYGAACRQGQIIICEKL